jgi:single-stranded DNA-binding protein
VNKCHFLGKVVDDPDLTSDNGVSVVNFDLEIEEFRRDVNGEKVRMTTYLAFQAWDTAAQAIHKYAKEGCLIAVEAIARNHVMVNPDNAEEEFIDTYFRVTNFKILGL